MNCEKLFTYIDSLEQKYLNVLEDVCNIESPTNNKQKVDEVGNYFIEMANQKITAIVEKYLGKGKKVSDSTPDQAEFIHLIVSDIKADLM